MGKLKMPDFQTDAEEAAWWFDNQDAIAEEYAEEHAAEILALVLNADDVKVAIDFATAKGLTPRDYVRQLVHTALEQQQAA